MLAGLARKISSTVTEVDTAHKNFLAAAAKPLSTAIPGLTSGLPPSLTPAGAPTTPPAWHPPMTLPTQGPVALTPAQISWQNDAVTAKSTLHRNAQSAAREIDAQTDALVPKSAGLTPAEIRRQVNARMGVAGPFVGPMTDQGAWAIVKSAQQTAPKKDINDDGSVDWDELYEQVRRYGVDIPASAVALGVTPNALWAFKGLIQADRAASEYVTGAKIAYGNVAAALARLADSGEITDATASTTELFAKVALGVGYITGPGAKLTEAIPKAAAGGIPDEGAWGAFGKVTGVLGIVGDVAEIIDPGDVSGGEKAFLRATSGVNLGATVLVLGGDGTVTAVAGALGVEAASVGWIPVAGQAVVIATGLVLAGDYLYHHWKPAKEVIDGAWHGIDGAYHGVVHLGKDVGHGLATAGEATYHGVVTGAKAVGHFFSHPFGL